MAKYLGVCRTVEHLVGTILSPLFYNTKLLLFAGACKKKRGRQLNGQLNGGRFVASLVILKGLKALKVSNPQSPKVFKALKKPPVGRPSALEIVSCSAIICIQ